ncbi:MAG: class I SAM-dependent methyltransferase [Paracoccus sp. (in: a-proteobacteria)]|uniref:class I SAM-dependent methyltransferase n=1 Tax=Paracoccus sp. TaxID=267 RepID=UPI0026E10136|nr:class I SAM-dependent methyltransferase [Paracoccus sp. (in: a-proteobacteria)]MDO5613812.1 class I SAM-dependent methyltransferase [Paracoccus sp. (in: a-proteobacteria)]
MDNGWANSAAAWIAAQGETGDFGRQHVLDRPMLARLRGRGFARALDVGCGEGRFCRMMRAQGIAATGIDPTEALIDEACRRDPDGDYRVGRAESLDFSDNSFDLAISYLSLIDIPDACAGLAEMARILRPGGTLLIANLNGFATAGQRLGDGRMVIDDYLTERAAWLQWDGIRMRNWHRPMQYYMSALLDLGLILRHFAQPSPSGGDPAKVARHVRIPYFHIMEWQVPT